MALIWQLEELDCRLMGVGRYLEAIYGVYGYYSTIATGYPYQTRFRSVYIITVCMEIIGGWGYDGYRFAVRAAGQGWLLALATHDEALAAELRRLPEMSAPSVYDGPPTSRYVITLPPERAAYPGTIAEGYVAFPDLALIGRRLAPRQGALCCWYQKMEKLRRAGL